jgi:glycerophosphoryl diester phosphodiesterase
VPLYTRRVPFLVAHRAGNDLVHLREAERLGITLVECDVRLWRRQIEVTHLRAVGRLPIHWEKWRLANPFRRRLRLDQLFDAASPETELMIDLKGHDRRLAELVLAALPDGRAISVCSRDWRLLEPFEHLGTVRIVYSVGTEAELEALLALPDDVPLAGISIHHRLLNGRTLPELRRRAALILAWPVATDRRAHELIELGVDGVITQDLSIRLRHPEPVPTQAATGDASRSSIGT